MALQQTATRWLGGPVGRLRFDLMELPTADTGMPRGVRELSHDDFEAAHDAGLLAAGVSQLQSALHGEVGLVAHDTDGQIAGLLWLHFDQHVDRHGGHWTAPSSTACYLNQLLVSPDFRRQGFAGRLVDAATTIGARRGRSAIRVLVAPDNAASRATFEAHGATTVHHLFGFRLGSRSATVRRPPAATSR